MAGYSLLVCVWHILPYFIYIGSTGANVGLNLDVVAIVAVDAVVIILKHHKFTEIIF